MAYVFAPISILSNRVMRLTQELAMRTARRDGEMQPPAAEQP